MRNISDILLRKIQKKRVQSLYVLKKLKLHFCRLTFADLAMGQGLGGVSVESLLALVTVPARSRVATVLTDSAGDALGEPEDLHVEAALPGMPVAVAL